jgi:biopolymer transport protein ExbB/TolQ
MKERPMQALAEFFEKGGFFMYLNLVVSTMTIAIIADRITALVFRNQIRTKAFLEQIRQLINANNINRAVKLCSASNSPVAKVAKAGLVNIAKGEAFISTSMEEMLVEITPELKKRISALWSLANIGTLLGLLGTIFGLIKTFSSLGAANPSDRARMLSDGIAEAMNNTALGLSIAVTCMVAHLFLSGISRRQQSELETFALKLENFLINGLQTKDIRPPSASDAETVK